MRILLAHGDGGRLTHKLVKEIFQHYFADEALNKQEDAALVAAISGHLLISTDSFVIRPPFFPGGDIGKLAVTGTVNDLAVSGAKPAYLTAGFILEEGLEIDSLKRIVLSMAKTAREAGIRIVSGDTKVVEKGQCDQIYINTTGIGFTWEPERLGIQQITPGDRVVINGGIAEHAVSVLSERAGISFAVPILSDCQPLNHLIMQVLDKFATVRFMRDPTRGGIATTLKEIATKSGVNIVLEEEQIPVKAEVQGALEILGLESYYMANEGKVLFIVSAGEAEELVNFLRSLPGHEQAVEIGEVTAGNNAKLSNSLAVPVIQIGFSGRWPTFYYTGNQHWINWADLSYSTVL